VVFQIHDFLGPHSYSNELQRFNLSKICSYPHSGKSFSFSDKQNKNKFRWRSRLIFAAATVHLSGCRVVGSGMRRVETVSRPRLSQPPAFLPALGLVLAATLPTLQDRCEACFFCSKIRQAVKMTQVTSVQE
jgi:hypothetical protein